VVVKQNLDLAFSLDMMSNDP